MSEEVTLSLDEVRRLRIDILETGGLSPEHARAMAAVVYAGRWGTGRCSPTHSVWRV